MPQNRISQSLLKRVDKAIREFEMLQHGDRIAVAVSGGKDSLSLLEILRIRLRYSLEKYSIVAIHVLGDARGPETPEYPELEEWFQASGFEYLVRRIYTTEKENIPMRCERCAWNRRRTLFEMARDLECGTVALGHHLNDLAETALLNLVYRGRNETMQPAMWYFGGRFRVIRPLVYVPEAEIRRFAASREFPPPPSPCPKQGETQRDQMREILELMRRNCPKVAWNLVQAALRSEKLPPSLET